MHKSGSDGKFTSSIGFVLAAVGSAVGMANIWLFPYRVGQYGGGAFLIPYFLFVALFSYVGLSGEFALGRLTGTGAMGSLDYVLRQRAAGAAGCWAPSPCWGCWASPSATRWWWAGCCGTPQAPSPAPSWPGTLRVLLRRRWTSAPSLALRGGGGDGRHPDLRRGLRH